MRDVMPLLKKRPQKARELIRELVESVTVEEANIGEKHVYRMTGKAKIDGFLTEIVTLDPANLVRSRIPSLLQAEPRCPSGRSYVPVGALRTTEDCG